MNVVSIPGGQFVENCYLVIDERAAACAVIDPGEQVERILHALGASGAAPVGIWLTHAHLDHVLGVPELVAATGAPVYLHPGDRELYDAVPEQASWFGLTARPLNPPDRPLGAGDRLSVGTLELRVRHTPGHSPGHVIFVGHGAIFAGDVLFQGSIGRTDLPGGDFDALIDSIERELLVLPDSTIVYPGHGPATTIGAERRTNPFLRGVA